MTEGRPGIAPFARHFWPAYAMALTPDGSQIVTGFGDGTIRRWDTITGSLLGGPLTGHRSWVLTVAVSPDGTEIVSGGGDRTIRRWDADSGLPVSPRLHIEDFVWSISVSPDSSWMVTGSGDGTVAQWNLDRGIFIKSLRGHTGPVRAVTASVDGSQIISCGNDGTVRRWDATTGDPVGEPLTGHESWVYALALTPDGRQIISAGDAIHRWDSATGAPAGAPLTGHTGPVFALTTTRDGSRIVSGGGDGTVRRWDTATGSPAGAPLTGHTDWVRSVRVTPDGGLIVSCGNDGTVRRWDATTGAPAGAPLTGAPVAVNALAIDHTAGEIISASIDGSMRRWHSGTGDALGRLRAPDGWVNAVTVSPDGRQIARAGEDGSVVRWDATTHLPVEPALRGHVGGVRAVAFTPDSGQIVTAGADGTVRRWDSDTGEQVGDPLTGHRGAVNAVVVTPDGAQIITAGSDDGMILRWDAATGAPVGEPLVGHRGGVLTVTVSQKGDVIVSGGSDATVRRWGLHTGRQLRGHKAKHGGPVTVVRFSADGRRIISGGTDNLIRKWDANTCEPVGRLTGHAGTVTSLAILPEGDVVLSGSADGTVRRWDLAAGTELPAGTAEPASPVPADAVPRGVLADVLSDLESTEDRLDITEDVHRIAAMLAALSVRPPLSVALLGDWGTGKSSFMRQLRDRLAEVARLSRASDESAFASNLRQVTFNAWHYSDDHLWVGLIEHMFRELATDDTPADEETAEQVAELKATLSTRKAERARLGADLDAIDRIDTERGWFAALRAPLRSARVARAALAGGWRELRGGRGWLVLLGTALGVATVVLAVRFGQSQLAWAGAVVAAVAGVLTPVVTVWRALHSSTEDVRRQLLRRQDELDRDIRTADDELGRIEPAHRLDRLLAEISTAERYESFRGLTGRIHHDLRRLSEDLAAARQAWLDGSRQGDPPLQRIVLYVDDLDRCTPGRVVDVLQAVNLLLTMDLFMVVVAVDPRWLLKALSRHHRGLLRDADAGQRQVSPLDYLDKIFHIPFALRPMGARADAYLRSLLPVGGEPEPESGEPERPVETPVAAPGPGPAAPEGGGTPAVGRDAEVLVAPLVADLPAPARPLADLNPEGLRVRQSEQDFLARLAPLLPTPRAVKKLANLYRMVRLSIRPGQLDAFLGDRAGGPYQAAALLLAALVGAPRDARGLLVALAAAAPGQDITEVLGAGGLPDRLAGLVRELRGGGVDVQGDVAGYQVWATTVARYGFETYDLFAEHPA
jgi:WD40 repeat protein